ncbi:MAG: hypothetical protein KA419_13785 [Acidobacteria bacterium]|nr:hypothetical protein [Acidobacteriota bacterium]
MTNSIKDILVSTWENLRDGFLAFLPGFLSALLIILAGLVVAWVLKRIVRSLLRVTRFDRFCGNAGLTHLLARADIRANPSDLVGRILFWLVFLLFTASGMKAMGIEAFKRFNTELILYLPNIASAVLILILGALVGSFLSRAALLAAVNSHIPSPGILGLVVKWLVTVLAFAMALEQLKIASSIVTSAFTIAFGAVMLGLAIAFGLGGRDIARRALEKGLETREEKETDGFSHL